jgi:hypothetical protein
MPILSITPLCKEALYEDLKKYTEQDQYHDLHELIFKKIAPLSKIVVTCTVEDFGATFYETGAIPKGGAENLSQQLPQLFLRSDDRQITDFNPSYLVKKLRARIKK